MKLIATYLPDNTFSIIKINHFLIKLSVILVNLTIKHDKWNIRITCKICKITNSFLPIFPMTSFSFTTFLSWIVFKKVEEVTYHLYFLKVKFLQRILALFIISIIWSNKLFYQNYFLKKIPTKVFCNIFLYRLFFDKKNYNLLINI